MQRLRHPLLPQLPGEPRRAPPLGAPSSTTPDPASAARNWVGVSFAGVAPFVPPCGAVARVPVGVGAAGRAASEASVRHAPAALPGARAPRGRLCLRFFPQGWRVSCALEAGRRTLRPRCACAVAVTAAQGRDPFTFSPAAGALWHGAGHRLSLLRPCVCGLDGPRSLACLLPRPLGGALLLSACSSSVVAPVHPTLCSPYTQGTMPHGSAGCLSH